MKWLALALVLVAAPAEAKRFRMPKNTRQLMLVTSDGWSAGTGKLQRFERGEKGPWKKVGDTIDVVLGRGGLGWGYGMHPDEASLERAGPLKQEGDGRSPAGVFKLGDAYGYAKEPPPGTKLGYKVSGPRLRCVDDPKAKEHYNQIVEEPENGKPAWSSAEHMKRTDELYARVIVVEHNKKPVVSGQGSCIFLHVWGGPQATTAGCTAMQLALLETVMAWLDPAQQPLLIQLPQAEYDKLKSEWRLP
jgi:D-alanyl-D-alanine dipeptidase